MQKLPLGHGWEALRVAVVAPTEYSPSGTGTGAPLPSGQYTAMLPHGAARAVVEFAGQK